MVHGRARFLLSGAYWRRPTIFGRGGFEEDHRSSPNRVGSRALFFLLRLCSISVENKMSREGNKRKVQEFEGWAGKVVEEVRP